MYFNYRQINSPYIFDSNVKYKDSAESELIDKCFESQELTVDQSAAFYDITYHDYNRQSGDVSFYLEECQKWGNSIFEVGIGTGRIATELLKMGKNVSGIDISENQLVHFKMKIKKQGLSDSKLNLYHGNILAFETNQTYDIIIMPFRLVQYFTVQSEQIKLFEWVKNHLDPGGKIIFDVFFTDYDLLFSYLNQEKIYLSIEKPTPEINLFKQTFIKDSIDRKAQTFSGRWFYDISYENGCVDYFTQAFCFYFYTYNELLLLFKNSGLRVHSEFGAFDKKIPIGRGSEMIFILEHKD